MSSKNKKQNKPKEQQPTQEIKKVDVAPRKLL